MTGYLTRTSKAGMILLIAAALSACSLTRTERTALTGGAIGAAAGTGIAAAAGGPLAAGALIGGAAGAASGALFEKSKRHK